MYYGEFSNKADICHEWGISDFVGEVIYANYERDSYDW